MPRTLPLLLLVLATRVWAHPGHGAPMFHWHDWDIGRVIIWLAVIAVAALAAWKAK